MHIFDRHDKPSIDDAKAFRNFFSKNNPYGCFEGHVDVVRLRSSLSDGEFSPSGSLMELFCWMVENVYGRVTINYVILFFS